MNLNLAMNDIDFQKIYEESDWYGNANKGRCPSVRLLPHYEKYLKESNVELGCGRGHLVDLLRSKGYNCDGYDQIDLGNKMNVADITKPIKLSGDTVICIDVIEHISDLDLTGLYDNFRKFTTQVFSIHNGPSPYNGTDLHINRKPFREWDLIIKKEGFSILYETKIHDRQKLYITSYKI